MTDEELKKAIKALTDVLATGPFPALAPKGYKLSLTKPKRKKLKCDCGAEKTNTLPHSAWCSKVDKK